MDFEVTVRPPFDVGELAEKTFISEAVTITFVDGRRMEMSVFSDLIDAQYFAKDTCADYLVEFTGQTNSGVPASGKLLIGYANIKSGGTFAISLTFDQLPDLPITCPYDLA